MNRVSRFVEDLDEFSPRETMKVGAAAVLGAAISTMSINGFQVPATETHAEVGEVSQSAPANLPYALEGGSGAVAGFIIAVNIIRRNKHRRA